MLADRLANEGVLCKESYSRYAWDSTPSGKLREDCQRQAAKDMENFQTMRNEQEGRLVEGGEREALEPQQLLTVKTQMKRRAKK